jgi:hypothetical protein
MKYWEVIADNLHDAGWCWGCPTVLSRTLSEVNRNPAWGVDDAITHARAHSNYLLETLQQRPHCLRVCDFFAAPRRRATSPIW